jgi:hypothetical protein
MGFYRRAAQLPTLTVITPREFTALFAGALRMVMDSASEESDTYRATPSKPRRSSVLLETLSRRARRHPDDPIAHRALGIAHLAAGNSRPAVRHLGIAMKLLRRDTTSGACLQNTLCARLEFALLLPVLVPLCMRLGRRETARRLVSEALLV